MSGRLASVVRLGVVLSLAACSSRSVGETVGTAAADGDVVDDDDADDIGDADEGNQPPETGGDGGSGDDGSDGPPLPMPDVAGSSDDPPTVDPADPTPPKMVLWKLLIDGGSEDADTLGDLSSMIDGSFFATGAFATHQGTPAPWLGGFDDLGNELWLDVAMGIESGAGVGVDVDGHAHVAVVAEDDAGGLLRIYDPGGGLLEQHRTVNLDDRLAGPVDVDADPDGVFHVGSHDADDPASIRIARHRARGQTLESLVASLDAGATLRRLEARHGGGFLLAGAFADGTMLVAATDAAGSVTWVSSIADTPGHIDAIEQVSDGSLLVAGALTEGSQSVGFVARLEPDGNVLWSETGDNFGYPMREIGDVAALAGGGLAVVGTGVGADGSDDIVVAVLEDDGAIRWTTTFFDGEGGDDRGVSVIAHPSGDAIVGGVLSRPVSEAGRSDVLLLRMGT